MPRLPLSTKTPVIFFPMPNESALEMFDAVLREGHWIRHHPARCVPLVAGHARLSASQRGSLDIPAKSRADRLPPRAGRFAVARLGLFKPIVAGSLWRYFRRSRAKSRATGDAPKLPGPVAGARWFVSLQGFHAVEVVVDRGSSFDFGAARRTGVALGDRFFAFPGVKSEAFPDAHGSAVGNIGEGDAAEAGNMLIFLFCESASPWRGVFSPRALYRSRCANDEDAALAGRGGWPIAGNIAGVDVGFGEFTVFGGQKSLRDIQLSIENVHRTASRLSGSRREVDRIALEENGMLLSTLGIDRFHVLSVRPDRRISHRRT